MASSRVQLGSAMARASAAASGGDRCYGAERLPLPGVGLSPGVT
jgi:hypothetical protein